MHSLVHAHRHVVNDHDEGVAENAQLHDGERRVDGDADVQKVQCDGAVPAHTSL